MEHATIPYFREILIFLGVMALVIPFFKRLRISSVLGFLIVGIALGPFGLIHFNYIFPFLDYIVLDDVKNIYLIGELGVVFLLFSIGLELSFDRLWTMRKMVFGLGLIQVVLCGLFIALVATLWGLGTEESVVVGAALSLSSTAVIVKMLVDKHQLSSPIGQKSFSILLMQDLAIVPILFLVLVLAADPSQSPLTGLMISVGKSLLAVIAIYLLGRYVLRPLFHYVSAFKSRDTFMAMTLLVIFSTGFLSLSAGMSMAVGAFLAGVMLAETEYSHQIEIEIEPFRGLFLGLFFLSVGMRLDLSILMASPLNVLGAVFGLILCKAAIIVFCCRLFGIPFKQGLYVGLMLAGAGEFAFVILEPAMAKDIVSENSGQFMMIVATATIFLTPLLFEFVQWLIRRAGSASVSSYGMALEQKEMLSNHIIIAGFGRVGRAVADFTGINQLDYVALDINGKLCQDMKKEGYRVYFGDAAQENILRKVNADKASILILTMDDEKASQKAVREALRFNPDITIIARARNHAHAKQLKAMGAEHVILEALETSLQIGGRLLKIRGVTEDAITGMVARQRQKEYEESL